MQFVFNDGYKRESGSTLAAALKFSFYTSVIGLVWLLLINGFRFEITRFSLAVAVVYAVVCVVFSYCSVKAFESANLSVYSVFSMIGGMVLPFVFGLFLGDEFRLLRVVGCVVLSAVIVFTADRSGKHKGGFKYYVAIFFLNGLVGVLSTIHQHYNNLCVDSASFMMLTKLCTIVISFALLIFSKNKSILLNKKALAYCGGHSVFNSVGNLMLLVALKYLSPTVQHPLVTGGTMLFAFIIAVLRRDKIGKKDVLGTVLAILATIIIVL